MSRIVDLQQEDLPENCFVFKHSTRCPVSFAAADEVRAFNWPLALYWINVVEQRKLSDWVAQVFNVKHESPQLIKIEQGKAVAVCNHASIKANNIANL